MELHLALLFLLFSTLQTGTKADDARPNDQDGTENPDPHYYMTWDGHYYDFHGSCNTILVRNDFLEIQTHTEHSTGYSYVDNLVLQFKVDGSLLHIDESTIDVGTGPMAHADVTSILSVGSYALTPIPYGYELTLANGQYIRFNLWASAIAVQIHGNVDFIGSEGMMGTWDTPGLIMRDGSTASSGQELGEDWRVTSNELLPGMDVDSGTCTENVGWLGCLCDEREDPTNRRRAINGADGQEGCKQCVTEDEVKEACAAVPDEGMQKNCEFDVMTTGDPELWRNAPFYQKVMPPALSDGRCLQKKTQCTDKGGVCVFGECIPNDEYRCIPGLCDEKRRLRKFTFGKDACHCRAPRGDSEE